VRTETPFSAPLITRSLIHLNQAACPVWDKRPVAATVFYHFPYGGTTFPGSLLVIVHLTLGVGRRPVCWFYP
jgi:hypothetical protein